MTVTFIIKLSLNIIIKGDRDAQPWYGRLADLKVLRVQPRWVALQISAWYHIGVAALLFQKSKDGVRLHHQGPQQSGLRGHLLLRSATHKKQREDKRNWEGHLAFSGQLQPEQRRTDHPFSDHFNLQVQPAVTHFRYRVQLEPLLR